MSLLFDRDRVVGRKSGAMDADEVKSANGKVLKVGSLVVPMSFTDKENKRHLSRVVLKITPKGGGFGPYVYLKGGVAPYKPNDLYAFDGCEAAQDAQFKVGDKVLRKGYPAPSPRDYYKVIEVHQNGGVMLDDGFNGYYNPNLIIRATDADEVKDGNGKTIRVGGKVQVEPSRGWHIKTPWGIAVGKVEKILPNGRVEVDFGQGDKTQIESTACVCVDAACDFDLTGYSKLVRDYLIKASKVAKGGDSIKAAGFLVKARAIMSDVESFAKSGDDVIGKAATAFLNKWKPVFPRLANNSTKGWNGELGAAMPSTDAAEGEAVKNAKTYITSRIALLKGKAKNDPKFAAYVKQTWNAAKRKAEYQELANTPEYKELDRLAAQDAAEGMDIIAFLKGQKVKFLKGPYAGKVGEYVDEGLLGIGFEVKVDGKVVHAAPGEIRKFCKALGDAEDSRPDVEQTLIRVANTLVGVINIFKRGIAEDVTSAEKAAVDDLVAAKEKVQDAIRKFR